MKFLRHLLVLLLFSCAFAHFTMGQQVLKVRIDAKELDRALLFQKLNEHGADHHMKFELVTQGYDYRVAYGTGQAVAPAPYGPVVATASVTRVFDAKGAELFNFTRDNRKTDAGAANATAKEIIKRIRLLRAAG
ncbi:MAG TPA: hypothetical protein VN861_12130 [Candidatus Acidoferrales bacterium]|nr:hypothetical protein [Candidatus Acidoferrales bacterium]